MTGGSHAYYRNRVRRTRLQATLILAMPPATPMGWEWILGNQHFLQPEMGCDRHTSCTPNRVRRTSNDSDLWVYISSLLSPLIPFFPITHFPPSLLRSVGRPYPPSSPILPLTLSRLSYFLSPSLQRTSLSTRKSSSWQPAVIDENSSRDPMVSNEH